MAIKIVYQILIILIYLIFLISFIQSGIVAYEGQGQESITYINQQCRNLKIPEPTIPPNLGATDPGPRNIAIDRQNLDSLHPPLTDNGDVKNYKWSFSQSHNRLFFGGWARQATIRDLQISVDIAGVDMRLTKGGYREMHWHKPVEWAYMIYGNARITAVDQVGRSQVTDVGEGDLWYFPSGIPHSIQGLEPDGCEFLLVFDEGTFSEYSTFQISDWFAHTPKEILAQNFDVSVSEYDKIPSKEWYIFQSVLPGPLPTDEIPGAQIVPKLFNYSLLKAKPDFESPKGSVRIVDSNNFPVSKNIAAAYVEVHPGGLRELHWHPNADEWQYFISGEARQTVFISGGEARTINFQAGDVGYVPRAYGHYIQNTGNTTLRFLETFKSDHYADVSAAQWLAWTPPEIVKNHLNVSDNFIKHLTKEKRPIA